MKTLHRPDGARIHRVDAWKRSAYAWVPYETHFGELCGFADDIVAPGRGFGMHPHRDMEITTIMRAGSQRHADSTGAEHLLVANTLQTMSAGTGIQHSEVNASDVEAFHSVQVWVYPRAPGGAPRYESFAYRPQDSTGRFVLAASPDRREGSALIGQDAFFSVATLEPGGTSRYAMRVAGHGVYIHCAAGAVVVAGQRLDEGDALGVWDTDDLEIEAVASAELVLVEVPMGRGIRA